MDINKATKEFIAMCHNAWVQPTEALFKEECVRCEGYSKAIKDVFGLGVWSDLVRSADLSFPEEVYVCAGVPIYPKYHIDTTHETIPSR